MNLGKKYLKWNYYPDFTITIDGVTFIVETKGENNNTFIPTKKGPVFHDKTAEVNFKHKIIDYELSKKGIPFVVIRFYESKRADGGYYVENDLKVLKGLKKKKLEYSHVPHAIERLRRMVPEVKHKLKEQAAQLQRLKRAAAEEMITKEAQFKLEL